MDHLPVPADRRLGNDLAIRFLVRDSYSPPFETYPSRMGWELRQNAHDLRVAAVFAPPGCGDPRPIAGLVQSWLYFGLLTEFLEHVVDETAFRRYILGSTSTPASSEQTGPVLFTEKLESMVCARTEKLLLDYQANGSDATRAFRDAFTARLLVVRHQTLLLLPNNALNDEDMALSCLAIAALADYLLTALSKLCQSAKLETPVRQKWRLLDHDLNFDCGRPLLQAAAKQKWCPRDLNLLSRNPQAATVSVLWYLANLEPPAAGVSHNTCTAETCVPRLLDEGNYVQEHVVQDCVCDDVGPNPAQVEAIIRDGKLPVVTWQDNCLRAREHTENVPFVAISHVWSDGMGNPKANSLPRCVIEGLQQLVDGLDGEESGIHFWIDTLCVPRGPKDLRNLSLRRLRQPYEEAAHVVIRDSYLKQHTTLDRSPWELIARIAVCNWSQRLWTFQEGRIPPQSAHVWFSFRNRLVNLSQALRLPRSYFPTRAEHTISIELLVGHTQTRVMELNNSGLPNDHLQHPSALRQSLMARSTSRAEDEAICLATLLGLSRKLVSEIIDSKGDWRMAKILRSLALIPAGIAFSKSRTKLSLPGYRWAPSTFMGDLTLGLAMWEGPNGTGSAPPAAITSAGLIIQRPAMLLGPCSNPYRRKMKQLCSLDSVEDGRVFLLCDQSGDWYACRMEGLWHPKPVTIDAHDRLILLLEGGQDFDEQNAYLQDEDSFRSRGIQHGLLASRSSRDDPLAGSDIAAPVRVAVHRHISCTRVSPKRNELLTILKALVDETGFDALTPEAEVRAVIRQRLRANPDPVALKKAINAQAGWGSDEMLAMNDCVAFTVEIIRYGPALCARRTQKDMFWCVD